MDRSIGSKIPLRNPTIAQLQVQSKEIWGSAARWSYVPTVRAYVGALPAYAAGIEFTTNVAPSRQSNANAFWYQGDTGVKTNAKGFAVITVTITKQVT